MSLDENLDIPEKYLRLEKNLRQRTADLSERLEGMNPRERRAFIDSFYAELKRQEDELYSMASYLGTEAIWGAVHLIEKYSSTLPEERMLFEESEIEGRDPKADYAGKIRRLSDLAIRGWEEYKTLHGIEDEEEFNIILKNRMHEPYFIEPKTLKLLKEELSPEIYPDLYYSFEKKEKRKIMSEMYENLFQKMFEDSKAENIHPDYSGAIREMFYPEENFETEKPGIIYRTLPEGEVPSDEYKVSGPEFSHTDLE